jgi:hypothetical protein
VGGAGGQAREHRGIAVELMDEKVAPDRDPRQPAIWRCSGHGRTQWRSMLRGAPRLLALDAALARRMEDGAAALGA